jgi:hypothetical protein
VRAAVGVLAKEAACCLLRWGCPGEGDCLLQLIRAMEAALRHAAAGVQAKEVACRICCLRLLRAAAGVLAKETACCLLQLIRAMEAACCMLRWLRAAVWVQAQAKLLRATVGAGDAEAGLHVAVRVQAELAGLLHAAVSDGERSCAGTCYDGVPGEGGRAAHAMAGVGEGGCAVCSLLWQRRLCHARLHDVVVAGDGDRADACCCGWVQASKQGSSADACCC